MLPVHEKETKVDVLFSPVKLLLWFCWAMQLLYWPGDLMGHGAQCDQSWLKLVSPVSFHTSVGQWSTLGDWVLEALVCLQNKEHVLRALSTRRPNCSLQIPGPKRSQQTIVINNRKMTQCLLMSCKQEDFYFVGALCLNWDKLDPFHSSNYIE